MDKTIETLRDIEETLLLKHDCGELSEKQRELLQDLQNLIDKYDN